MAQHGSPDVAFLLIDGLSILGTRTDITDSVESPLFDATVLGDSWEQFDSVGVSRGTFDQNGFYNDDSNSVNDALINNNGTPRTLMYGFAANVVGGQFRGCTGALRGRYLRGARKNELTRANASFTISGSVDEGVILLTHAAQSGSTGNTQSTSHDNGAQTTDGGYAYLELTDLNLNGYTSVTFTIRDSADDASFASLTPAFTARTAIGAERIAISGTIRRYTAVQWAFTGSGSTPSFTAAVGLVRL